MTQQEIMDFCTEQPAEVVETLIAGMQRVIDFRKGRGAMLAALSPSNQTASDQPKEL